MTIAAVVLAAGAGSRFGGDGHKLLAPFRGTTVVQASVGNALDAGLDDTIVVTGAVDLVDVLAALPAITIVQNHAWNEGLALSLRAAVAYADRAGHEAIVVGLGDQPLVPSSAWEAVARADEPIAVATYEGERRNPVRLDRSVWPLLPTAGDEGARVLMRLRPALVQEIPCLGEPADIDTVEDLTRWS